MLISNSVESQFPFLFPRTLFINKDRFYLPFETHSPEVTELPFGVIKQRNTYGIGVLYSLPILLTV